MVALCQPSTLLPETTSDPTVTLADLLPINIPRQIRDMCVRKKVDVSSSGDDTIGYRRYVLIGGRACVLHTAGQMFLTCSPAPPSLLLANFDLLSRFSCLLLLILLHSSPCPCHRGDCWLHCRCLLYGLFVNTAMLQPDGSYKVGSTGKHAQARLNTTTHGTVDDDIHLLLPWDAVDEDG